jgi:TATA-box binding protein (TBP) (component of TFIID and TFIIIB)
MGYLTIAHCLPCKIIKLIYQSTKCCCKCTAKSVKCASKASEKLNKDLKSANTELQKVITKSKEPVEHDLDDSIS